MSRTPRATRVTETTATPTEEIIVTTTDTTPDLPTDSATPATDTAPATPVYGSAVLDGMVARYATSDASGKAKIRAALDRIKSDLVRSMIATTDPAAQATIIADLAHVTRATDACVTAPKAARTVDYRTLVRDRAVRFIAAAAYLATDGGRPVDVPDGTDLSDIFPADVASKIVDAFVAIGDFYGDKSAADATALATAKVDVITRAAKRDTAAHIVEVLSATPGTFRSVAFIAKGASVTYGDDRPSSGAVSAALFAASAADRMPNVTAYKAGDVTPDGTKVTRDGAIFTPDPADGADATGDDGDDA